MDNWELYYRTHAKGVGKELTGSPPLSFVSNGQPLADYRIYGNSGGVGNRTGNLFDKDSESVAGFINDSGVIVPSPSDYPVSTYDYINVLPNTYYSYKAFSVANNESTRKTIRVSYYKSNKAFISRYFEIGNGLTKKTIRTPNNCFYVRLSIDDNLENVMLWEGSSNVSYEPYGYKIPIICGGRTTNIYLDEPLTSKLPTGYTQVEYIRSTGTQYIDTGIKTNTTTSRYETKINPSLVSGTIGIFGTRNGSTANQSSMNVFIIDGIFRLDWLNGAMGSSVRISSNTEYAISITRGLATINNVNYKIGENTSIDGLYTFYVGSFNNVGSVYSNGFSGKIYYSKLYNNNILVFDGVPCYRKSDNEIGMYDLVSNTFFTNAGTGSFIAGAEVETVYYTDYIDYAAQKRHNSDGTESSVTLPEISTLAGTNTLTVGTEVQPSNMYIKYVGSNVNQSLMKYLEYKYKVARNKED